MDSLKSSSVDMTLELPSVPWDKHMISGDLQKIIAEILPSADTLDSPDFNPIDYINAMFPNEQSLIDVDTALGKVKARVQRIDEEILREVRVQSRQGRSAKTELNSAQVSIGELFNKIGDIKAKAEQSERMVTEICRDIKSLDHAKTHLTASITTLRRLQMLVNAVDQLRERTDTRQYKEVGNLLQAVNQLYPGFSEFKTIPKIQDVSGDIDEIKLNLNKLIYDEFNRYESQLQVNGDRNMAGTAGALLLRDVCFVIDALGEVTKQSFMTWYINSQLKDYQQAFQKGSEVARLDSIERRYAWLKREFRYYEDTYATVFPEGWKVLQSIADEFCITTRLSLSELLETSKNYLDIVALVNAVKKTIEFEKELCTKFQEKERPIIHDDEDEEDEPIVETGFLDDVEDDGTSSPYSATAIKKKWERHKALKEKEKRARLAKIQKHNPPAALQFKGKISSCFDPYMDLYIEQEDRNMKEMLNKLTQEETWSVSDDDTHAATPSAFSSLSSSFSSFSLSNKVLASSTDLIYYFNEVRKRCGSLTKGQPFYELFMLFKKYLNAYAAVLSNKIGEDQTINSSAKPLSEKDEQAVCLIVNTADYCSKTTGQMTEIITRMIDERFKEKIDFKDEAEAFSVVTSKALKALANSLEAKLEPALHNMARGRWDALEGVGEQSDYVSQIDVILKETVPMYKEFFTTAHFQYICDSFINSFVSRGIIQNLYKCKRISEVGAQQLLLDFATLKATLLHIAGQPPPNRYVRLVNKEMGRAEAVPKLILTPNDVFVDTYRNFIPSGSESDLVRILELKGVRREEKTELTQRYRDALANMPSSIPSGPPPPQQVSSGPSITISSITSAFTNSPFTNSPLPLGHQSRASTPPLVSSNPLSTSASSFSKVSNFKKFIPDSILSLNKNNN